MEESKVKAKIDYDILQTKMIKALDKAANDFIKLQNEKREGEDKISKEIS